MIFSLLFLSIKKVEALYNDLNAPYNYTYTTNIQLEGKTLPQRIAKAASCNLKCSECPGTKPKSLYCQYYGGYGGLYGGYGGIYGSSLYGSSLYGSLYGGGLYGGLY